MKTTKKLAALFLALMMVFSLMAVTAAAYGAEEHEHVCSTETIQPRKPGATCFYCADGMRQTGTSSDGTNSYLVFTCYNDDCPYFKLHRERATQEVPW